ncbi:MAG: hypothetical protein ABEJ34_05705 [Haloferacaceae archaeon]
MCRPAQPSPVSEDVPDRPPVVEFARALNVRRNAAIGVAVGVGLAALTYLVRVLELLGPVGGTRSFPVLGVGGWFLLLAAVLASATAALVTTLLTLVSAYRLVRSAD